jgi:hypothetical protein
MILTRDVYLGDGDIIPLRFRYKVSKNPFDLTNVQNILVNILKNDNTVIGHNLTDNDGIVTVVTAQQGLAQFIIKPADSLLYQVSLQDIEAIVTMTGQDPFTVHFSKAINVLKRLGQP